MAGRMRGKVALVTGAGSGIGAATARRLAAEGARVVGCDVSADGLAQTRTELEALGLWAELEPADVTSQADVDGLIGRALTRHGRIDGLANIAGVMDWFLPAHEVDDETWARVMAVNVEGPMRLMRAVLPGMIAQHSGVIVNIASEAGLRGAAGGFAYTASKHAVLGLTRSADIRAVATLTPVRRGRDGFFSADFTTVDRDATGRDVARATWTASLTVRSTDEAARGAAKYENPFRLKITGYALREKPAEAR